MIPSRAGGVLLHLTSLPGGHGIGDLGAAAHDWLGWLHRSGCALWQFLPLGPCGAGWSPYQSPSTFAGNPLLISLEALVAHGWLRTEDPDERPPSGSHVDFPAVTRSKSRLLKAAAERWRSRGKPGREDFESWCAANADWLDDYALFMALKDAHAGAAWTTWDPELAQRRPAEVLAARKRLRESVEEHGLQQYWFWTQWRSLRNRAAQLGIRLIGDLPIYVSEDSADVWSRPDLFQLGDDGRPVVVAGVPPDYFSETGQLWANPIYDWDHHREEGYRWWIRRVRHLAQQVDCVRIDHFRGLSAYWEVPAGSATAATGRWVEGPGGALLEALRNDLGGLPLIAEDLGVMTADVLSLRDSFQLPGMKILQFGLEAGEAEDHLPDTYPERCVAYTGTHDNDTSRGWYQAAAEATRDFARRALATDGGDIAWSMVRSIWSSKAAWSVAPIQDFLSLGTEARMNYPGRAEGNWTWRLSPAQVDGDLADRIRDLNDEYGRVAVTPS